MSITPHSQTKNNSSPPPSQRDSWRSNAPKNNTKKLAEIFESNLDLGRTVLPGSMKGSNVQLGSMKGSDVQPGSIKDNDVTAGVEDEHYESLVREDSVNSPGVEMYTNLQDPPVLTDQPQLGDNIYLSLVTPVADDDDDMPIYENTNNDQTFKGRDQSIYTC